MQRASGNAGDDCVRGDIARDDGVGADGGVVADGDTAKDGDAAANPDLLTENDGFRRVAGVTQLFAFDACVISVANTGVLTDHAAFA